jgi:outer membrane protein assembly factor BamB/pimeloyl-ACP methyl ester carboxylesterase
MRYSTVFKFAIALLGLAVCGTCTRADDWPGFLGKNRNGISAETSLIDAFPASGPVVRWRVAGGVGMSAVVVQGDYALTTWNADGQQWLVALDTSNGSLKWRTPMGAAYKNAMGDGPRATPTIAADRAYAYSGEGILIAVDLASGRPLWRKDVVQELSAKPSEYGMSCSPLVIDDRVIVHAGADDAAVVAFATSDGKLLWKTGTGHAGYSSPVLMDIAGTQQVVAFSGTALLGIDPDSGKNLWSYPFETDYGCNTASPVAIDGGVFISSGENHGSVLLDVKKLNGTYAVSERWKSLDSKSVMRNEWQTSIVIGEHLYGFDNVGAAGPVSHFSCIEAKSGKPVWQKSRFGKGNLVYADGKFWLTTIEGDLVIAKADTDGFQELSRATLVEKNRQTLSIANGCGYLRDDSEVVCIELATPKIDLAFEGETIDSWHGFKRHKFSYDGQEAWVVEPKSPRADGRFSWCMMFPDAFTQQCAAPMLVGRGYYHVYLSVGNSFGAPKAIEKLDAFHKMLVRRGLHPQAVLIGISRGGLYAHRYAATYPERVSVIYDDAAVLDYQSWPGGKGKGKGSPGDWQELRKWYGFESDEQAADYPHTPLKTLGVLAKHQIAIVSVVGDIDEVVPVDENTALAEKIYKELAGVIEVIHKPGVGHHPHGLDDPTPVVEFIEKYTMQK